MTIVDWSTDILRASIFMASMPWRIVWETLPASVGTSPWISTPAGIGFWAMPNACGRCSGICRCNVRLQRLSDLPFCGGLLLQRGERQVPRKPTRRTLVLPRQDHVKPSEQTTRSIKAVETLPSGDHRLLHEILRQVMVGVKRLRLCQETRLLSFHQLRKAFMSPVRASARIRAVSVAGEKIMQRTF